MGIQKKLEDLTLYDKSFPYKKIKKMINSEFTQEAENQFKNSLDEAILGVFTFMNNKEASLISSCENENKKQDNENIKNEIYEFSNFVKINTLAIKRIIQRHDKFTGFSIMPDYQNRLKDQFKLLENLLKLISEMNLKHSGHQEQLISKFWIPQENLVDIKLGILEHLEKKVCKDEDSCVSTIYLDNTDFSLYTSYLEENDESALIRLRWYGIKAETVMCQLLTRFGPDTIPKIEEIKIPKKLVLSFINGNDIWGSLNESNRDVYNEIHEKITIYRLRPTVRTFFKRTVFESSKTAGLKINLDTNIAMIRECSTFDFEHDTFPLKSWARTDVAYDWPFRNLSGTELIRFPYSVLEIISGPGIVSTPNTFNSLDDLLSNVKIEKIKNFSKFVHGCALLYPKIGLVPAWMSPITQKIRQDSDNAEILSRSQFSDDFLQNQGESEISYNLTPIAGDDYTIAIPVKIEPKVFFANERTFLSWIQFAIFLGGIGTAMIGLGNEQSYLCGAMLIGVSAIFSFYALYLFHYRAVRIRVKNSGPYDDIIGPSIITAIFIIVMILSFVFKFPVKKNGLK